MQTPKQRNYLILSPTLSQSSPCMFGPKLLRKHSREALGEVERLDLSGKEISEGKHCPSPSHSPSHSHSVTHCLSPSHSHSVTHTHTASLPLTHTQSLTHTLPLSLLLTLSHSLTHCLSPSYSHSVTHSHTASLPLTHTQSLTHTLPLSPPCLCLRCHREAGSMSEPSESSAQQQQDQCPPEHCLLPSALGHRPHREQGIYPCSIIYNILTYASTCTCAMICMYIRSLVPKPSPINIP